MRRVYSAVGTLLGVSLFKKFYYDISNLYDLNSKALYLDTLSTIFTYDFLWNFGLLNCLLFVIVIIPKLLAKLAFGDIIHNGVAWGDNEVVLRDVKEKFNYTLFEFFWGLIVLKRIDKENVTIGLLEKYASLFLCLHLLKSFHYLTELKMEKLVLSSNNRSAILLRRWVNNFMGISILILIDLLLIWKFKNDDNSLSIIFGYESLNLLPLIMYTMFQFQSLLYLKYKQRQLITNWGASVLEFCLTLVRFTLFVTYSWFYYQKIDIWSIQMIPSSYKCFRLVLSKLRYILVYKRNELRFTKLENALVPQKGGAKNDECFCLESFVDDEDTRLICCGHAFHFECLKWWLIKSMTCPICREEVHIHSVGGKHNEKVQERGN